MDGELGLEQSQAVADHLAGCAGCAEEFSSLRQLVHWTSMIPDVEPPAQFSRRILAAAATAAPVAAPTASWSLARAVRDLRVPRPFIWATCACATAAVAIALAGTRPSVPIAPPAPADQLAMITPQPVPQPAPAPRHLPPATLEKPAPPSPRPQPVEQPVVTTPAPVEKPVVLAKADLPKPSPKPRAEVKATAPAPRVDTPPVANPSPAPPPTQPKSADPSTPPDSNPMSGMVAEAPSMPSHDAGMGADTMGMMPEKTNKANVDSGTTGGPVIDEELQDLRQFLEKQKRNSDPPPAPPGLRRPL